MNTQNTATESTPIMLTNTDLYTVRIGGRYAWRFKEGDIEASNIPAYYTLEEAQKVARSLQKQGYKTHVVLKAKKEGEFFMDKEGDGHFADGHSIQWAPQVRRIFTDVPQWFIDAMRVVNPSSSWWTHTAENWSGDGEAAIMIFQEQFDTSRWLDHEGWSKEDEDSVLVAEPYSIDGEELAKLMEFVKRCDLDLTIRGTSYHYPSSTLRIEVRPKEPR
jgi:hypothetical protein